LKLSYLKQYIKWAWRELILTGSELSSATPLNCHGVICLRVKKPSVVEKIFITQQYTSLCSVPFACVTPIIQNTKAKAQKDVN